MPRTLACQCPHCDATFPNRYALGQHKRWAHGPTTTRTAPKPLTQAPPTTSGNAGVSLGFNWVNSALSSTPAPPAPIPCATCWVRASDVEKGLIVVLIRAGMSVERAMNTVKDMAPVLKRNGNGSQTDAN